MTTKFSEKFLFKEMPNLLLGAKKRTNFERVRNPGNRVFRASAVVYLILWLEKCAALRLKF